MLTVVARLAGAWLIASGCFLLGLFFQLFWVQFLGRASLTFDYLAFWTLRDWAVAAISTPIPLLIAFVIVETWRVIRKKPLPFRAYAVFPVMFFLIWTIKVCVEETGIFVILNDHLRAPESLFFIVEGSIWLMLMIILSFCAAKVSVNHPRARA